MLTYFLYNLCRLLTSSFNNKNQIIDSIFPSYINLNIYKNLILKNTFYLKWRRKLHHIYSNFHFTYNYEILNQHENVLMIKLIIHKSFSIPEPSDKLISCESINNYLILIDYCEKSYPDIIMLISEEENPILYNRYINTPLTSIKLSYLNDIILYDISLWKNRINNINQICDKFLDSCNSKTASRETTLNFNIVDACNYAEKYALSSNPEYKNFDKTGGDCTNFVSQILHAGGINYSSSWKPYTHPWIRVEELYNYLINNKLGRKIPDKNSFPKGSVIQFYTPQKGYYFHSGFITYVSYMNEAYYSCHSYNKRNYPLSEIYPVIYPVIRCITLN